MMPWAFFQKEIAQATSATSLQQVISVIDRPYPYAVAGTPLGYRFVDGYQLANGELCSSYLLVGTLLCPATRRFSLTYSTTGANGRRPTGPTLVYVPKEQYPAGYRVSVSGGRVTSAPGARWLAVQNDAAAAKVTVVVVPQA